MSNEEKFWNDLTALCPLPEVTDPNNDKVFESDPDPVPNTGNSTSELLEKIANLEKMINDMTIKENGNNLQTESDLSDS